MLKDFEQKYNNLYSERNSLQEQNDKFMKDNESLRTQLATSESESEERQLQLNNELKNVQSLLKERGKQLEEVMKTMDTLKNETNSSVDVSNSFNMKQSVDNLKSMNLVEHDRERLLSHLYNLTAEICAFSRIEGN